MQSAEQKLIWAEAINHGLMRVFTDISIRQVRLTTGDNPEKALMDLLATVQESIQSVTLHGTTTSGETDDISDNLRTALRSFLRPLEETARQSLGLAPRSETKN